MKEKVAKKSKKKTSKKKEVDFCDHCLECKYVVVAAKKSGIQICYNCIQASSNCLINNLLTVNKEYRDGLAEGKDSNS